MAEYDNIAFNNMREAAPDMDIGGAIETSEYEENMDVFQRKGFEKEVLSQFLDAYNINPLKKRSKGRLPFESFVKLFDQKLVSSWAEDAGRENMELREPLKHRPEVYRNAEKLMKLSGLHTGRLGDIKDIAMKMYARGKKRGGKRDLSDRDGGGRFVYPGYWSQEEEDKMEDQRYKRSLTRKHGYLVDPKSGEIIYEDE